MSQSSKVLDLHELLHKKSFHPKHSFEGILKSLLIRFLTMFNNMEDFHEATPILFKCSTKQVSFKKEVGVGVN